MVCDIVGIRKPYIDGKFVVGEGNPLTVDNPATEQVIADVETCSVSQFESAVLAARRAFDSDEWSTSTKEERIDLVLRLADYMESVAMNWPPPCALKQGQRFPR